MSLRNQNPPMSKTSGGFFNLRYATVPNTRAMAVFCALRKSTVAESKIFIYIYLYIYIYIVFNIFLYVQITKKPLLIYI